MSLDRSLATVYQVSRPANKQHAQNFEKYIFRIISELNDYYRSMKQSIVILTTTHNISDGYGDLSIRWILVHG